MMPTKRVTGFSLIEVVLALGVFSVCAISVLALLPVGAATQRQAIGQLTAISILGEIHADLRSTPNSTTTSPQFAITFNSPITLYFDLNGALAANSNQQAYRVRVTFPTNSNGSSAATLVALSVTWPAAATPTTAPGKAELLCAFDRH